MPADEQPTLRGVSLIRSFSDGGRTRNVIDDVTLDLHRGQITLLMGPSGSGKSTLLAILSGLLQPDRGQVLARENGHWIDVWRLSPREREQFRLRNCGFIFQGYNLFPALTARQQLEIVLRWGDGVGGREARQAGGRDARTCSAWRARRTRSRPSCPAARSSGWRSAGP